ncbi:hypothetical protein [Fusobacterium perfoetens]|uniref:hypothetical protein n=1 Tax=Fusobacterium perfoetens TaxID=852 RepID=UPI001F2E0CF3|nr:hypothetical protein [Fusobacterium perfoetens]MCF2611599.1 hypothetical protein [Fusobacterium perfoetens]
MQYIIDIDKENNNVRVLVPSHKNTITQEKVNNFFKVLKVANWEVTPVQRLSLDQMKMIFALCRDYSDVLGYEPEELRKILKAEFCYENPIQVTFDNYNREHRFDLDGKYNLTDINPFLFWDEIKFNIPEKPFNLEKELKKLEVIKFECGEENFSLHWDHEEQEINITCVKLFEKPSCEYFTRDSIEKFKENIKNKKITKEQFFKAYEKVFRQSKEE